MRKNPLTVRNIAAVLKRTLIGVWDDQLTHHAAALTYYSLMSLFPAALLALSILGLVGQYPATYDAIVDYLADVVPASALDPIDASLREAFQSNGTAATAGIVSVALTFYGTTGALEAARRAMNVIFEIDHGRSFLHRKANDVLLTILLMALVLSSMVLLFVGGSFADDVFGFLGLGQTAADVWNFMRWPAAVVVTMLVFALIYFLTPDVKHRSFKWVTPGAAVAVVLWLGASYAFSTYISRVADVGAVYGAFAGAIILVGWLWLTNLSLLIGAELDAEIERQRELRAGIPMADTLDLPAKTG